MNLEFEQVDDAKTQENFKRLLDYNHESPFQGMTLVALVFGKAETALKIPHGLRFAPKDAIITQTQGSGNFSIDHSQTDRDYIVISTTGACTVRLLIGTLGGLN